MPEICAEIHVGLGVVVLMLSNFNQNLNMVTNFAELPNKMSSES